MRVRLLALTLVLVPGLAFAQDRAQTLADIKAELASLNGEFNALKNELSAFGGHYEVVHHTQAIDAWIAAGRLKLARPHERVIYHEPCYLGRHNGEYEAPRRVLRAISKDTPLEFALARDQAMCCGAGGGRMWLEETIGTRINVLRAEQALERQPAAVATACPYCAVMVGDGLAQKDDRVAARDIAELVADALT